MNPIESLTNITFWAKIGAGGAYILAWTFGVEALPFIYAYVGLATIDFVTGWCKAIIGKRVESNAVRTGVGKKTLGLLFIATCNIIDGVVGFPIALAALAGSILCLSEAISILENLDECGVPVKKIIGLLKKKQERESQNDIEAKKDK